MIEVKETTIIDINNVQKLWADGDVMRFVGFPNGLYQTDEEMQNWFQWIESSRPVLNHYSIFEDGKYCGESFYKIDREHKSAALDIKLFGFARGRGIATAGLSHAIKYPSPGTWGRSPATTPAGPAAGGGMWRWTGCRCIPLATV